MTASATALGSFSAVDADPGAAALLRALDEQASIPAIQRLRATATELLAARLGHRLIDVGCGTGDVVRALAGIVGPHGSVLGIEASEIMRAEAKRRAGDTTLPVEFRPGDINTLDLDDAAFDGTLCERVLQHVASPQTAMAELVRITKPGGRVVVIDTDWGLHAIHGADPRLTSNIVDCWANNAANGLSGRRLPALFAGAGIRYPIVVAETITSTDPLRPSMAPFTTMAAVATHANAVSDADADAWLAQLLSAGANGHFFWALTMFAVSGTRPSLHGRSHDPTPSK